MKKHTTKKVRASKQTRSPRGETPAQRGMQKTRMDTHTYTMPRAGLEPGSVVSSRALKMDSQRPDADHAEASATITGDSASRCSNVATLTDADVPALREAFGWIRGLLPGGGRRG